MKTITTKVYTLDELAEEAKEKAREWYRQGMTFPEERGDWIIEDVKEIGKLMGIDVRNVYYSGFSSQGDGACFEGFYIYRKQGAKKVKEYAPEDRELHRIAEALQAEQHNHFYCLEASVGHSGHYYHKYCTDIHVFKCGVPWDDEPITTLLRDFMHWIYKTLEEDYNYQMSDECVDETILCNEFTFTEEGKRFS